MAMLDSRTPDDLLAWLRLTLSPGISCMAQQRLLTKLGSAAAVVAAPYDTIAACAGTEAANALARGAIEPKVQAALRWLATPQRHFITMDDSRYPAALREIADPPAALYVQGRTDLLNNPAFAIVGSRNATTTGLRDAESFAAALAHAGFTIVSGFAHGIDSAAHRGALTGPGSTIAVMGTGADMVYPPRNEELARAVAKAGTIISEFPLGTAPLAGNFPRRNRLISGLVRGVLVVEAALRSGSLTTARLAAEQNRDVFALPGSIHAPLSKGCHKLIKEGAKLVESVADVLEELGCRGVATLEPFVEESEPADPLLQAMGFGPMSVDEIASRTGRAAASVSAHLTRLELAGAVAAIAGGLFQRLPGAPKGAL